MARAGTRAAPAPWRSRARVQRKRLGLKAPRTPPTPTRRRPPPRRTPGGRESLGVRGERRTRRRRGSPIPGPAAPGGPRRASPGGGGGGPPRRGRCRGPRPRRARRTAPPYARPVRVLQVALPLPLPPMSYLPPLGQEGEEALGRRVAVPFRGEVQVGVVVGEGGRPSLNLRHAIAYLDPAPYLRPEEILFLEEAARYLFAPLGQVLADFLPPFPLAPPGPPLPGGGPEGPAPGAWGPGGLAGGPGL